jgi:hypothetical protein
MVDVSLRHKSPIARGDRAHKIQPGTKRRRTAVWLAAALAFIAGGAWIYWSTQPQGALDLVSERRPVELTVAGHSLVVPSNMLRSAAVRAGGAFDQIDLVLHWPDFDGYSEQTAADFTRGDPRSPVIYATIGRQLAPLDATARLDTVYARLFAGKPLPAPAGLVGRTLAPGSGFDGDVVYFVPSAPQPFVARCQAAETPEVPSTCLRDINFGGDLTILFRFDRSLLGHWQQIEAGMRRLAANVLVR